MAERGHIHSALRRQLLAVLSAGGLHSGQALAEACGVSRAAVWKQLDALERLGLGVERVKGRGYRLTHPLELFDEGGIRQALAPAWREALQLNLLESADSTNEWLAVHADFGGGPVACLAEAQPAGRGRRGRQWTCLYGAGIPLSLAWRFDVLDAPLSGLAPSIAVSIVNALESMGARGLALKWPNDVLCDAGKLAGVLIELKGEPSGPCDLRVGVGLNWAAPTGLDQPVAGLDQVFDGRRPSRSAVAGRVLSALCDALERFRCGGFAFFREQWAARDCLAGRPVTLLLHERSVNGHCEGVDAEGALLLRDGEGECRAWQVGEVSARLRREAG
ncbi:biotin--[acetyl-CoA-carboxylase] ligase [Natronospira bacteriovora]|uniref:Bifunctional ligase/repressor BirA n=1 Tax=Natronospira bacteriovora TaxID=3069753 RepID=A0ABU0W946_9GAMM|nr:biotin--[acetyl-CoA-carboxylase] ligase [Natronospira sp. AB-CW4]MDQ2070557.1 biotin--[acetyl-CoA-carboxylase] ligase [Natronospira sp. AB-CW4]